MNAHPLRNLLDRLLWHGDPHRPTSTTTSAIDVSALRQEVAALQEGLARAEAARAAQVLYCPRCAQHLPARSFPGHMSTVWTLREHWGPHPGFTAETIAYSGAPMPCPGGA